MEQHQLPEARYLIIDDEELNVALLEGMLEEWGCTSVVSTTDPREAVSLFTSFSPDIVLLDLMMPYLDGFAVMHQLRSLIPPDSYLPILVLTADTSLQTKRRALGAGGTDFLTKPFDAIELSLRINHLVQARFMHLELQGQNTTLERRVEERTRRLAQAEIDTIECLALAGEYRDDDTGQHTQRVGQQAALLAAALGIDPVQVEIIRRAAPLHDIGKIGIPDTILLKPGKLTVDEFTIMKKHTEMGARILARHHTPILQVAASIALMHHERWDGSGYPHGLKGEEIALAGRLVAIVDVFDALTHVRPYKPAWPVEAALAEVASGAGRLFDPLAVTAFVRVMKAAAGTGGSGSEPQ
jgi:putative two-component system response regulator